MLTWDEKTLSGVAIGNCLSKDVPTLPITGSGIQNGASVYVIDTPDGTHATSKLYKFDGENKVWIAQ